MFLKKEHWPALQRATGFSDYALIEWLKKLQIFSSQSRREWTPLEEKVMANLYSEGIKAATLAKILNRADHEVRRLTDRLPINKEKQERNRQKNCDNVTKFRRTHPERWKEIKYKNKALIREYANKNNLVMRISKKAKQVRKLLKEFFAHATMIQEATPDFLKTEKSKMRLDFYFPQLKLAVEYDGEQHDQFVEMFHQDRAGFERAKVLDAVKSERCKEAGVNLIRFNHTERITKNLLLKKLKEIQAVETMEGK